jgi:hypothetical protein
VAAERAGLSVVKRQSGIIVPQELEQEPDPSAPAKQRSTRPTAYDPDGRRRVVLMREEQRRIDRMILELRTYGLGLIICCSDRWDGKKSCGQALTVEAAGTPDAGYGCQCTRIHFCR